MGRCRLGGMEDFDRTETRGNDLAVSETYPLASIFAKNLLAFLPVIGLVLSPIRVNLLFYLRRQALN